MDDKKIEKFAAMMSLDWTCVECKREFPSRPDQPGPHAFRKAKTETGLEYIEGHICKECYEKPSR